MPKRSEQIPIALDQLINTIFGGWADETISSRAHRMQGKSRKWARLRKVSRKTTAGQLMNRRCKDDISRRR